MIPILERWEKPNTMTLVLGISTSQFLQYDKFISTSFVPKGARRKAIFRYSINKKFHTSKKKKEIQTQTRKFTTCLHCFIVPYDFYGHFFRVTPSSLEVLCTNYSWKNTLPMRRNNFITTIKHFSEPITCSKECVSMHEKYFFDKC